MANYKAYSKTNWFRVNDEKAFTKLVQYLDGEGLKIDHEIIDGVTRYCITAYDNVSFYIPASMSDKVIKCLSNNIPIYDKNRKEISYADIDSYNELYTANECIYYEPDNINEFEIFLLEMQKLLPENECFSYTEIGHEKVRYIDGKAIFMTKDIIKNMSLEKWIKSMCHNYDIEP